MTAGGGQPEESPPTAPETMEEAPSPLPPQSPPPEVLNLWTDVGNGIDQHQTVVWRKAVDSLDQANKYLRSSQDARFFAEKYMSPIISILVEQQPAKIGANERSCVTESLALSSMLIVNDLQIKLELYSRNKRMKTAQTVGDDKTAAEDTPKAMIAGVDYPAPCVLLETLVFSFNKKKAFYKGTKSGWNVAHGQGLPEVRIKTIERFRSLGGFPLLKDYLVQTTGTPSFPKLEFLQYVLLACFDTMVPARATTQAGDMSSAYDVVEDDAIMICDAVMYFIKTCDEDELKQIQADTINELQLNLQKIFDRLISTRRDDTYRFYAYWRALALKLITSQSLPLKLFGWEQVDLLIEASTLHQPPPKSFVVRNAGCTFVNGIYEFAGSTTPDGYATVNGERSYVRAIPEGEEGAGKKLTLFRCTMRSQQKWWFLSEADEEQPGTDRDIDYYQHKSKEHEEAYPPPEGWFTCRSAGVEPPPLLEPRGVLVPAGQEYETLDHQLAKWAIENEIVQQVLGDTTIHREVVARSTKLIKFLAGMCSRYPPATEMLDSPEQTRNCLQTSHLLFAWKTCLRKADAVVSSQVYQLLVSILPLCPTDLAIPLLKAVQTSLRDSDEKRDYLFEVSEFCAALSSGNLVDAKSPHPILKDVVREEVLDLLWSVLTHRDASALRTYDSLKRYVSHELRVEPKGREHRVKFLGSCVAALEENAKNVTLLDEVLALRMVKLTHFVIEACPREQAEQLAAENSAHLPNLLYRELTSYLQRRKKSPGNPAFVARKLSATASTDSVVGSGSDSDQHLDALNERLRNLRHVYGLTDPRSEQPDPIVMSFQMIETLWRLCDAPADRAALMLFVANASHSGKLSEYDQLSSSSIDPPMVAGQNETNEPLLSAAFSVPVTQSILSDLFCSTSFGYVELEAKAYRSFQFLFNSTRLSEGFSTESRIASLDALWRICLTVSDDAVATQAMKNLLNIYIRNVYRPNPSPAMIRMGQPPTSFGERIVQCLSEVNDKLKSEPLSVGRPLERCLRILNSAIGQDALDGHSIATSSLIRLSLLSLNTSLDGVMQCLPHGMRGQASYRRVGILVKRPPTANAGAPTNQSRMPSTFRFPIDLHPLETLASVKGKVSITCRCGYSNLKVLNVTGRAQGSGLRGSGDNPMSLNTAPEDSVVDELGIVDGCEVVFLITDRPIQTPANVTSAKASRGSSSDNLSHVFFGENDQINDKLFTMLLDILKAFPWAQRDEMNDDEDSAFEATHRLVWDFLLAMPTNSNVSSAVKSAQARVTDSPSTVSEGDSMEVDSSAESWKRLLDLRDFDRSVYVLMTIDSFLRPAPEVLSILPTEQRQLLQRQMTDEASSFRRSFIEAGGFDAVVRFFSSSGAGDSATVGKTRRGNAVSLRILKSCLFGATGHSYSEAEDMTVAPDEVGNRLLSSLSDSEGLLKSLTSMVVDDPGISSSTIIDVLRFLRLLFRSPSAAKSFVALPSGMAQRFLVIVLLHEEAPQSTRSASANAAVTVRRSTHDLILQTPILADSVLPWLVAAVEKVETSSDSTAEYFDVLEKLLIGGGATSGSKVPSASELRELGTAVCKKLASCPRPSSESETVDLSTGVLCGCLRLLRALIERGGSASVQLGSEILVRETSVSRWSEVAAPANKGLLGAVSSTFGGGTNKDDDILVDIMGAVFDGFLTPGGSSPVAVCCDKDSRRKGFEVVSTAARHCESDRGYRALVDRINHLVSIAAPKLRHRWGQFGVGSNEHHNRARGSSKYSGLRNQGCTCYMNSVLQQLFMMPELRHSMCSASVPASLRSSGGASSSGDELVGKKISLQWENGVSYDAVVEGFNSAEGTHSIRYCPTPVATVGGSSHLHHVDPNEIARLPPQLPDEFVLSEGRPGKETGVFEVVKTSTEAGEDEMEDISSPGANGPIQETVDESASRHLLEEVQRTFIHLDEGSRGRCFDPRALVEACACLKLEFDVWQQNDASEFTTKLLDRLEISLKKYAPSHFRYMDHTFGLKQTKQKICKECGLKTNREEKLLNIDCQIRGKADIHEALASMTEVEIMEGSNKVFCDRCKKNTDTILRSAISTLPNMLILSLKRFDLDFTTFETVKLNSRCAFGETLNMKQFTLEGLEAMEKTHHAESLDEPAPMDTDEESQTENEDRSSTSLPDEDYEYRLAGVLVHAGVAQGGHYYSFIKDRNPGSEGKWYRFDDEDVTPFDPASIETECFGGKVKKETKWPNGQVHTVEQEQFANALMLFYEKVKPSDPPESGQDEKENAMVASEDASSGYDVFKADVRKSNATHRWQSFLFDTEFHEFMKGLLGLCRMKVENHPSDENKWLWRRAVLEMILVFVFDVLLYSSDRGFLKDWPGMLRDALRLDKQTARSFTHSLARKTKGISTNWLRTYLLDCPDQSSRAAAAEIFGTAIESCTSWEEELKILDTWCQAWESQSKDGTVVSPPLPCSLVGQRSTLEDVDNIDADCASSIGIIISFINVLLEAIPRCWRFSSETCVLIRLLVSMEEKRVRFLMQRAMVVSFVPPRLVALAARDRLLPHSFREAFPGASASAEAANTQTRSESNHNAHVVPIGGNHVMHGSDMNTPRGPSSTDFQALFEALACLPGLPGMTHAPLVYDAGDTARNRRRYALTNGSIQALALVFWEWCSDRAPGMTQQDIENYLDHTGVDANQISGSKILELLNRYPAPAIEGRDLQGGPFLSLDGFLAYYCEGIQSDDSRLRQDLHLFGFRPDLSRRSESARFYFAGNRRHDYEPPESVARDVKDYLGSAEVSFGSLADTALSMTFHVFGLAFQVSESLSQYLVACVACNKDCKVLIDHTLQAIYQTPNDWNSGETIIAATSTLQVIACLPEPDLGAKVSRILESTAKASKSAEHGAGILPVLRALKQARNSGRYNDDVHWTFGRYLDILKSLRKIEGFRVWMDENRASWSFIERDLLDNRSVGNQTRGDYGIREGANVPLDHHTNSDSDAPGMNDSEEDDDSQFDMGDQMERSGNEGPVEITVSGAGLTAANGIYRQDGYFKDACKYALESRWNGRNERFLIFQCSVSNNTQHWYISIVPPGVTPGTSSDIDFYTAPADPNHKIVPPTTGWIKAVSGLDPPPVLELKSAPDRNWNSNTVEDDENDNRSPYV